MNLDQRTGLDDSDYLNIRFSKLNFFDRNVLLTEIKWRTGFWLD